ncbi:MAG: hypothetical protein ACHQDY_09065, partial [Solirubrobacterales bacterium]
DSIETGATTLVVKEIVKRGPPEAAGEGPVGSATEGRAAPTVFAGSAIVEEAVVPSQEPEPAPAPSAEAPPASAPSSAPAAPAQEIPPPAAPARELPPPRLNLEIDFEAREARIALGDDGETVRLVFADGAWRVDRGESG